MHESEATMMIVAVFMALMLTASAASVLSRRMNIPYTILLVLVGLALGHAARSAHALAFLMEFRLTPEIVLYVLLPVLLFESAFNLDARQLIKNLLPIAGLAVPALLVSTAVVGAGLHYAIGLRWEAALLFGALISATDPVAVVALFKEMGAPKRLGILVEGESLFNDGTALVVFKLILGIMLAGSVGAEALYDGALRFVMVAAGGVMIGVSLGAVFARLIHYIHEDRLVEITLTTVLAHSSFLLAEHLGVSGVMATVAAGLTMGSYGRLDISPAVFEYLKAFWEYVAFVCNSLIFLLVGLSIDAWALAQEWRAILIAAFIVIAARALAVFGIVPMVETLSVRVERISRAFQGVIVWGGLRGALAIVMALSIPAEVPERQLLLTLTLGIVLFSLLAGGLTIKRLMAALGFQRFSLHDRMEVARATLDVKRRVAEGLPEVIKEMGFIRTGRPEREIVQQYEAQGAALERATDSMKQSMGAWDEGRMLLARCLRAERKFQLEMFEEGIIAEDKMRDVLVAIERQLDRVKEGVRVYKPGKPPLMTRIERAIAQLRPLRPLTSWLKAWRIAGGYEIEHARLAASTAILKEIGALVDSGAYSEESASEARELYAALRAKALSRLKDIRQAYPEYVERAEAMMLKRLALGMELRRFEELGERGGLSSRALKQARERISSQIRRLRMRPVEELHVPPMELLARVPLFAGLGGDELAELSEAATAGTYLPGDDVVVQASSGDSLFIVGRGRLRVIEVKENGDEVPLKGLGPGDFFGETALLHPQPRTATVRAETHCTLLELEKEALMPILEATPALRATFESAYRERVLTRLLAGVPAYEHLDPAAREEIARGMRLVSYKEGEEIFRQGSRSEHSLLLIKSGSVHVMHSGMSIKRLGPADHYFVEPGETHTATLTAEGPVEAFIK